VPAVAVRRFDVTFSVTGTSPVAGDDLAVKVTRNGTSVSDTVTVDALLSRAVFQYTAA
jgi:hypothetical protein